VTARTIKVDSSVVTGTPTGFADDARAAEQAGYDGIWASETRHDPAVMITLASQATERIELGTAISVAFARTPMTLAATANDLQLVSGGRFVLGLGTQIRPHITKRFSMPWSHPAARMHEYIRALHAIWDAWDTGERLDFRGEFYTHTLMTPFFSPGPQPHGRPPVHLAGVGPRMTEVAGELADGFIAHAFTTEQYLQEVTLPALRRGRSKAGRPDDPLEFSATTLIATGRDQDELDAAVADVRRQVAFYGSTPAYAPVLEMRGWGDLARRLNQMSKRGEWEAMGQEIDDEVLHTIAVVAEPDEVGPALERRFAGLQGITLRFPFYSPDGPGFADGSAERWVPALHHLHGVG
jgi:probable F420-dependent oxidoreductase